MRVKFKRFSSRAKIPQKGSACYDLFAAKSVVLEPNATRSVETDLVFCFPKNYVAKYSLDLAYPFDQYTLEGELSCYLYKPI